ncbi:putative protein TPRXL [Drosophila biarmipes]|uniref:putative protein TPRXL n=1 Tax=Drosophila biarmipes TaxID=125945 RepID=UPI0007E6C4BC|nr:putative protein TPRXL [Drosophila biarmipes]
MGDTSKRSESWTHQRDSSSSSSDSSTSLDPTSSDSSSSDSISSFASTHYHVALPSSSSSSSDGQSSNKPSTSTGRRGRFSEWTHSPPEKRARSDPSSTSTTGPYQCPVCLKDVRQGEPVATSCGHIFCTYCLLRAIRATSKCPMCSVRLPGFHRVYM